MKAISLTAPSAWASYLINGDASGLEPAEIAAADAWIDAEGMGVLVGAEEAGFIHIHDAHRFMPLAADCDRYTFLVRESPDMPSHGSPDMPSHGSPDMPSHGSPDMPSHGSPDMPSHGSPDMPTHVSPDMPSHGSPDMPSHGSPDTPKSGRAATHTPGPWRTVATSQSCVSVISETHAIVADVYRCPDIATREYNGMLIAAAPELLAALQGMLAAGDYNDYGDFVISCGKWDGKSDPPYISDASQITAAHAAIAKATGAQS